jgi:hypothetical protein
MVNVDGSQIEGSLLLVDLSSSMQQVEVWMGI